MNLKRISIIFAAMLVLGACRNHEKSITGAYGNAVVTGQVTMAADVANNSPAGVMVTVGGTGMTAVLGADGRFSFAGVPEGATLRFTRVADGISAAVASTAGFNAVELSKTAATTGSRRRSTVPATQIEGTITSAAADSIVVKTESHGSYTVTLTTSTVIRKGHTTVAATDLKVGDQVHVQATFDGKVYTATQVILQNPEDDNGGASLTQIEGTLSSVAADSITVTTQSQGDVKVALTSTTTIRKGDTTVAAADLKVGDRVHVMATSSGGTFTATQVIVQNDQNQGPSVTQIEGKLSAAAADSITVDTQGHGSFVVALTSSTIIRKGQTTVAPGDLKVGDQVHVKATFANNTYTALEVIVQSGDDDSNDGTQAVTANGIVSSTGTNSLVVHTASGKDITVNVNDQTIIRKYGKKISLSDIKSGDQVESVGTAVDAHTILAKQIEVQNTSPHGNH